MSSIPDILNELGIHFCQAGEHHHVREGWVGLDCPWCPQSRGDKGRYRLGIEIATGRTNCWVCGSHSLASALVQISRLPFKKVSDLLIGVKLRRLISTAKDKPVGKLEIPKGVGPMLTAHRNYLHQRGFNPDKIERLWNVQGIGLAPQLQWSLFIPISLNGELVSWTSRTIGNKSTKYISASPEQERHHFKDSMYGIDLVRSTIIIVEGPIDTWAIGPGGAATYGLKWTPRQVAIMSRFAKRVVCFDNEVDAQRRAGQLCETLSLFPGRTINVQLDAKDPGEASKDEIRKLREAVL